MPTPRSRSPSVDDSGGAEERLARLEKLLAASLGYNVDTEEGAQGENKEEGTDSKKDKEAKEGGEEEDEEVVSFRLFSTSAPASIRLHPLQDPTQTVLDPRIRDVEDESKEMRKRRKKDIKTVVVDGEKVMRESKKVGDMSKKPINRHATRTIVLSKSLRSKVKAHSSSATATTVATLPNLCYLNAFPPSTSPSISLPAPSTSLPAPSTSLPTPSTASTPLSKRMTPHRPLHPLKPLHLIPISYDKKRGVGLKDRFPISKSEKGGEVEGKEKRKKKTGGGKNRLNKSRREYRRRGIV